VEAAVVEAVGVDAKVGKVAVVEAVVVEAMRVKAAVVKAVIVVEAIAEPLFLSSPWNVHLLSSRGLATDA